MSWMHGDAIRDKTKNTKGAANMSGILDRLRDTDKNRERFVMGGPRAIVPLLRDAADEIERLREQLKERNFLLVSVRESMQRWVTTLEKEK